MANILSCARYLAKHYGEICKDTLCRLLLTCDGYSMAWFDKPLFPDEAIVKESSSQMGNYRFLSFTSIDSVWDNLVLEDEDKFFIYYKDIPVVKDGSLSKSERYVMNVLIESIKESQRVDLLHILQDHKSFCLLRPGDTLPKENLRRIFKAGILDIQQLCKYDASLIAQWFYNKSIKYGSKISFEEINILLFCAYGLSLINETIDRLFDNKIILSPYPCVVGLEVVDKVIKLNIDRNTEFLLECVWRAFGQYCGWKLKERIKRYFEQNQNLTIPTCVDDKECEKRFRSVHFSFVNDNCI